MQRKEFDHHLRIAAERSCALHSFSKSRVTQATYLREIEESNGESERPLVACFRASPFKLAMRQLLNAAGQARNPKKNGQSPFSWKSVRDAFPTDPSPLATIYRYSPLQPVEL